MNFETTNDYQRLAQRTLIDTPPRAYTEKEIMLVWVATGLAGKAGEVVDYIKKGVFHDHGVDAQKVAEELGDLLWSSSGSSSFCYWSLSFGRYWLRCINNIREEVNMSDVQETLNERGRKYGAATWATGGVVERVLRNLNQGNPLFDDPHVERYTYPWRMILNKLIRATQSPNEPDHWRDIIGYAQLVLDDLTDGERKLPHDTDTYMKFIATIDRNVSGYVKD